MDQAQDSPERLELPRSIPAWLGVWIAVIGILPADALVSLGNSKSTAAGSSMLLECLEFPLLVIGGAAVAHLAQTLSEGNRLRLWRILGAVMLFDVVFVLIFHLLDRCAS